MNPATVRPGQTLAEIQRQPWLESLELRQLLGHALGLTRVQLITQSERVLRADEAASVGDLIRRRQAGEPLAYLLGRREFYGLDLAVTPDVLIPRPETELLVDLARERLLPEGRALDLGTGSGAIAIALAHVRPDASVTAADISPAALAVAENNRGRLLGGQAARLNLVQSDWCAGLAANDRFDVIVANPPYIAAGDPHLAQGDLRFEPVSALTDHADGLSALITIIADARNHLEPGGWLLLEHGYDQAESVRNTLIKNGYFNVQSWRDLAGIERVSGGQRR